MKESRWSLIVEQAYSFAVLSAWVAARLILIYNFAPAAASLALLRLSALAKFNPRIRPFLSCSRLARTLDAALWTIVANEIERKYDRDTARQHRVARLRKISWSRPGRRPAFDDRVANNVGIVGYGNMSNMSLVYIKLRARARYTY